MCGSYEGNIRTEATQTFSKMTLLVIRFCFSFLVISYLEGVFIIEPGLEAKKVFDDAQRLLEEIIEGKLIKANGVVGFYPANSCVDDILVFSADDDDDEELPRNDPLARLCALRQQAEKDNKDEAYLCLSDFIAPVESGVRDYIGMFAVSAGFSSDQLCAKFQQDNDDYHVIMTKALADRLAEAFAEALHEKVRTQLWAYSRQENLGASDLHRIKYKVHKATCLPRAGNQKRTNN